MAREAAGLPALQKKAREAAGLPLMGGDPRPRGYMFSSR